MEGQAQVPTLVDELRGETHDDVGRRLLIVVAVLVVNLTVGVAVHIDTFQRLAVGVVHLLVDPEGTGGLAHVVSHDGGAVTAADGLARGYAVVLVAFAAHQFRNLVVVPRNVVLEVPGEVLRHDGLHVETELNAIVLQRTDVLGHDAGRSRSHGDDDGVQQVGGLAVVTVQIPHEASVLGREVQTGVVGRRGLPLQTGIVGRRTGRIVVLAAEGVHGIVVTDGVHRLVGEVGADALLTGLSPSEAQFQVVEPRGLLHELLTADAPGKSRGGEVTEACGGTLGEARRTVGTEGDGEEVALEQRVVDATEVGHQTVVCGPCLLGAYTLVVSLGRGQEVTVRVVALPALSGVPAFAVVAAFLGTGHDAEVVYLVPHVAVLGVGVGRGRPLHVVGLAVPAVVVVVEGVGRAVVVLLRLGVLAADVGVQH